MSEPLRPQVDHPQIPVRALLAIVAVMALAVSLIWALLQQALDPEVVDPYGLPTSTVSVSTEGSPNAGAGSPDSGEQDAIAAEPGSLEDMLGMAPDRLADGGLPLNDVAQYANIEAWMSSGGIARPTSVDDPELAVWQHELEYLALPTSLTERGLDSIWSGTYGFSLLDVDQVLVVGQAPDLVVIMRGSFDTTTLQNAWVANGYQAIEVEGTTVWSLSPEDRIDLSAQASRPAMGSFNNIAVLANGMVAASARTSRLGSLLEVANGQAPSLAERDDVAALFARGSSTDGLVSAVIAKGELLQTLTGIRNKTQPPASPFDFTIRRTLAEVAAAQTPPPADLVLFGIHPRSQAASGTPSTVPRLDDLLPTLTMVVVFDGRDNAELGARVMADRFRYVPSSVTGQPYAVRFGTASFQVVGSTNGNGNGPASVVIDSHLYRGIVDWRAMIAERDFAFAMWQADT